MIEKMDVPTNDETQLEFEESSLSSVVRFGGGQMLVKNSRRHTIALP